MHNKVFTLIMLVSGFIVRRWLNNKLLFLITESQEPKDSLKLSALLCIPYKAIPVNMISFVYS